MQQQYLRSNDDPEVAQSLGPTSKRARQHKGPHASADGDGGDLLLSLADKFRRVFLDI